MDLLLAAASFRRLTSDPSEWLSKLVAPKQSTGGLRLSTTKTVRVGGHTSDGPSENDTSSVGFHTRPRGHLRLREHDVRIGNT
jgi:hypothetical protein